MPIFGPFDFDSEDTTDTSGDFGWATGGALSGTDADAVTSASAAPAGNTHKLKLIGVSAATGVVASGSYDRVIVEIRKADPVPGSVQDRSIRLALSGSLIGNELADTVTNWPGSLGAYTEYVFDNLVLTEADVPNLEAWISATCAPDFGFDAQLEHVRVSVERTVVSAPPLPISRGAFWLMMLAQQK